MGGGAYVNDSLHVSLSSFFNRPHQLRSSSISASKVLASMRAVERSYCVFLQVRDHYKGFRLHSDKGYTLINAPKWFTLRSCAREFISPEQKINFEVTALSFMAVFCVRRLQKWTEGFFFSFLKWSRLRGSRSATDSSGDLSPSAGRLQHVLPPECNIPDLPLRLILASQVSYFQPCESSPAWVAPCICVGGPGNKLAV